MRAASTRYVPYAINLRLCISLQLYTDDILSTPTPNPILNNKKFITSRGKMWMCGYADVATGKMRRKMRIIREICMWLNGYFTSSAVIVVRRCPCLPSSPIVLVVHHHLSVCQKSAPLHLLAIISTDFLHKIYPQLTCCNICTYAFYHCPHVQALWQSLNVIGP